MEPIRTERLILRRFRREDAAGLLAYLREPRSTCFASLRLPDLDAAHAEAERRAANDEAIAVALRDTDQLIGDLFAVPEPPDTFSIGWNFDAAFAGAGYASEAAQALVRHLFEERGARRLYAYVEDHNVASQRLCERLCMRREGVFLEFVSFVDDAKGRPVYENTMQYALLRREWRG
ncbi:GNAT family N-acetyltransferase [Aureimonas jatrophae]|uniref:Protein N-acetyltransferase, RimJ/RimL family n=1 Tax=Aureimonas jatrophae TaxID=1166073 RepID=A0A1H0F606_9HYPH|nr:GNAT family protein [Aureimonas jatrophae]MBB3950162.1 RimJ/RimL family protein N-acetyltransferase [Aureimonas jatrophae]SDN90078.1 Protein N-acetyltransferase, RimJ/RimL family [Aureimonas jatrophae]